MRPLRILLAALVAALTTVVVTAGPSFACSCASAGPADFVERAEVVVTGTVTQVTPPPQKGVISSADPTTYVFDVDQVYKGESGTTLEVLSPQYGASCGLENVEVGERYVVFASHQSLEGKDDDHLWANLCGGTDRATPEYVAAVEDVTGPGQPMDDGTVTGGGSGGVAGDDLAAWALPIGLAAGASLLLLTGSLWVRQRVA